MVARRITVCNLIAVVASTGLVVALLVVAVSSETEGEQSKDGEQSQNSEKAEMAYVRELTNE